MNAESGLSLYGTRLPPAGEHAGTEQIPSVIRRAHTRGILDNGGKTEAASATVVSPNRRSLIEIRLLLVPYHQQHLVVVSLEAEQY
jgi:hypothetical protein